MASLKLDYVNPTGMFSYGLMDNILLKDKGIIYLQGINEDNGGSNGSGKSSLFNSICEILYGKNPTKVGGASLCNVMLNSGFCGRVGFEINNVYYRVTSARKWKKELYPVDNDGEYSYTGTDLFFEYFTTVWNDGDTADTWIDCRGASMNDTRNKIVDVIGMTYERFISISYMSNRSGNIFLKGTNKDRMELLSDIIGLKEWDVIIDNARKEKLNRTNHMSSILSSINYTKGQLNIVEGRQKQIGSVDWSAAAYNYRTELESYTPRINELKKYVADGYAEIERLKTMKNGYRLGEVSNSINDHEREIIGRANSKKPVVGVIEEDKNIFVLSQKKASLNGKISHLNKQYVNIQDKNTCPICDSKITKSKVKAFEKSIQDIIDEIAIIDKELIKITASQKDKINELEKNFKKEMANYEKKLASALKELDEEKESYNKMQRKVSELDSDIYKANFNIVENSKLLSEIERKCYSLEASISQAEENIKQIEELYSIINKMTAALKVSEEELKEHTDEISMCDWFITNVPYIKLHKLSVSMVNLSNEINKYLEDMGDSIRVSISSFEERKSKQGVSDFVDLLKSDIKIEVRDGNKLIDLKLYSDGETSKISNAFIRAIHDISSKHGHGCNVVMFDEIFSFLDIDNSTKLSSSFMNNDISTMIFTDNSGMATNLMGFDEVWLAKKRNGVTSIGVQK